MTISSSATSSSIQASYQGVRGQLKKDLQDVTTALQSGDLTTAQGSFADLQKLLRSSGVISTASGSNSSGLSTSSNPANPVLSDFQTLGQDLAGGDLASARKDFAQLQNDATHHLQAHHHHHGYHRPTADNTDGPAPVLPAASQQSTPTVNVSA